MPTQPTQSDSPVGGSPPEPPSPPAPTSTPGSSGDPISQEVGKIGIVAVVAISVCLLLELLYAFGCAKDCTKDCAKGCGIAGVFGILALVSASALAVGAVVGFIFGVPKSGAPRLQLVMSGNNGQGTVKDAGATAAQLVRNYKPNTNLEVMSDWLVGVIVGAGLVGLKDLVQWFGLLCHNIAAWMPCTSGAGIASGAAILGFFSLGFLCVYLLTRLFLTAAFERAEGSPQPPVETNPAPEVP